LGGSFVAFRLAVVRDLVDREEDSVESEIRTLAPPDLAEEVHRLALGMLWHPAKARWACGQILRGTPRIARSDPAVRRFVLQRAVRYLLDCPPSQFERQHWTFELLAKDLARGRDEPLPPIAFGSRSLSLVEEVKLGCSQTMLLCLDRPHRIAYLLGTLDGMDARTSASILAVEPAEFVALARHAEDLLRRFTREHCGLVNPDHPCRCSRRLGRALVTGRVDPEELLFAEPRAR
jgi:hypothetical protein